MPTMCPSVFKTCLAQMSHPGSDGERILRWVSNTEVPFFMSVTIRATSSRKPVVGSSQYCLQIVQEHGLQSNFRRSNQFTLSSAVPTELLCRSEACIAPIILTQWINTQLHSPLPTIGHCGRVVKAFDC